MATSEPLLEMLASLRGLGGVATSMLRIFGIVLVAWLLIIVAQRAIRTLRIRIASRFVDREAVKRIETSEQRLREMLAESTRSLSAYVGEIEDKLDRLLGPTGGSTRDQA